MDAQKVVVDEIPYDVLVEGPRDGKLVVLVHALMANKHMWDSTVLALHAAGYRTLRYDHLGHDSTPPPSSLHQQRYHFDDLTRHLQRIIEGACPKQPPYALIGCSIGGILVMRYAMMFPGAAQKIISCSISGMTSSEAAKVKWRQRIEQFRTDGSVDNLADGTIGRWFPDPCGADVREKALQISKTCTFPGYEIHAECIMNYDYSAELDRIQHEDILILAGENDTNIGRSENLVKLAHEIKGARFVSMEETGHVASMHRPAQFEKIVLDFLGE